MQHSSASIIYTLKIINRITSIAFNFTIEDIAFCTFFMPINFLLDKLYMYDIIFQRYSGKRGIEIESGNMWR